MIEFVLLESVDWGLWAIAPQILISRLTNDSMEEKIPCQRQGMILEENTAFRQNALDSTIGSFDETSIA